MFSEVILFVRMWVEIQLCSCAETMKIVILFVRMWVEICSSATYPLKGTVILFVRMWVEIYFKMWKVWYIMSSSSWGCELKYYRNEDIKKAAFVTLFVRMWVEMSSFRLYCLMDYVILFVRMWVEMLHTEYISCLQTSSSSWGCELKCLTSCEMLWWSSHPLREDVSWNDVGYGRVGASCRHPPREDVGWNLEEYGVNHRCSNMVFLVGRWIEISLIVFLSFARRSHYYTSFNLNIKLNYRNLRGNFYMCS